MIQLTHYAVIPTSGTAARLALVAINPDHIVYVEYETVFGNGAILLCDNFIELSNVHSAKCYDNKNELYYSTVKI